MHEERQLDYNHSFACVSARSAVSTCFRGGTASGCKSIMEDRSDEIRTLEHQPETPYKVVIDPGRGGKDKGATFTGIRTKTLVFQVEKPTITMKVSNTGLQASFWTELKKFCY